jgi:hypothetical protein
MRDHHYHNFPYQIWNFQKINVNYQVTNWCSWYWVDGGHGAVGGETLIPLCAPSPPSLNNLALESRLNDIFGLH